MPSFRSIVDNCPIITAVKNDEGLVKSISADSSIVFILYGDIMNIAGIISKVKAAHKIAMVHIDLINGLSNKDIAVDYIKKAGADGIISTRPALIKTAREAGLYTVLRFFAIDSMAYDNISSQCRQVRPDCMEILPGIMPKVIKKIVDKEHTPVIAGGLITDKEDIMQALEAGAVAVSSTNEAIWKM